MIRSDPARAREILAEGLEVHPDSPTLRYNLACLEAVEGRRDSALDALRKAIGARPDVANWAHDDDDLASLRDDPEFQALVNATV